jgi:aryl-alcohol dehydrogenase-like predicted oxidoreductase
MQRRMLGASGIDVSVLALGSWRTFEHISRDEGVTVMTAARECGISFLDDARYNDETGSAPLPSGYSEIVFGELFRAAGWKRDDVVVANKLWWEFWPDESAAQELDASLGRMGFDYLDLVYAAEPPEGLAVPDLVGSIAELVAAGKARAWGVLNWPTTLLREAVEHARLHGLPEPSAAQLPYNLVLRDAVEGEFATTGMPAVASMTLWFGALSGKYATPGTTGRIAGQLDTERVRTALAAAERLRALAAELDATPAALAIAFTLANEQVAAALFGATAPEQVLENAAAPELLERLTPSDLAALRAVE